MTFGDFMRPFTIFLEWARTYNLQLGGVSFTFFEMWTYIIIAIIVVAFIKWIFFD